jgi:hypothetical protein
MEKLEHKLKNSNDIDLFLGEEISKNIKEGYPSQPKIEKQLKNHLKSLLESKKNSR